MIARLQELESVQGPAPSVLQTLTTQLTADEAVTWERVETRNTLPEVEYQGI